jgi:predicted ABC-type ATPase
VAKWVWIVGGPNGAGKTTIAKSILARLGHADLPRLNADDRTAELRKARPDAPIGELNLQAANETDAAVDAHIAAGKSFVVETVLSSAKYRERVKNAKARGFKVGLLYVSLWPPELSPRRVRDRVAKGGHDVETARALARHERSHRQLNWFAGEADRLVVLDNSQPAGSPPTLVATKSEQTARLHIHARGINPAVDKALNIRPVRRTKRNEPTP